MDNIVIRKKLRFDLHRKELLKIMSQFTLLSKKVKFCDNVNIIVKS